MQGDDWWRLEMRRRTERLQWIECADPKERATRRAVDAEQCRRSFFHWASQYGWMYSPDESSDAPARRLTPFVPWPRQCELIEFLMDRTAAGELAMIPKARKLGVTWICLMLNLWWWLFEDGFSAILGSRKEELVDRTGDSDSLFQKLRFLLSLQPEWILPPPYIDNHLILSSRSSELVGESTNVAFGQGKRRRVAVIDEAARVDEPTFASTWIALESTAHSIWLIYNPGSKTHKTYQLHKGEDPVDPRFVFEMTWRDDPRRDEEWKRGKLRPRGRLSQAEFESAYECRYGYVSTGKIWDVVQPDIEYHEDLPVWVERSERVRAVSLQIGGWDFGSGPSALVCLYGLLELGARPVLWIDDERVWQQTSWRTAGADTLAVMSGYGGRPVHFGDPAGIQKESDQSSWETNLRAAGVPLMCLPAWFNTRDGIEWGLKYVQTMFDEGRIRVHRRCRVLWRTVHEWRRNVPDGLSVDDISKAYIEPMHGVHSHAGHALRYLCSGASQILHQQRQAGQSTGAEREMPAAPAAQISQVLGQR